MKSPTRSALLFLGGLLCCHFAVAEKEAPAPAEAPRIIGAVADGTPPEPAPKPDLPDFRVLETHVRKQGGRTVTIQKVDAPDLPAPSPPPEAQPLDLDDPEVQAWLAEMREKAPEVRLVFISATVHDHQKTFLRWWVTGDGGPPEEFNAWSNIDFNHLCGFGSYEVGGIQFGLMMGIGNTDSKTRRRMEREYGIDFAEPECPELPADRPAYAITKGDTSDKEGMALIEGLHDLYASEKERLIAAYEGREAARLEREAYLKEHPPIAEDILIYSWEPEEPPESPVQEDQR